MTEEKGYIFAYSYNLNEEQIEEIITSQIKKLDIEDKSFKLKINVVRNRQEQKLGYSYLWIDNLKIFNALIGLNYDGSERVEKIVKFIEKEQDLNIKESSWGDIANSEETITECKILPPLVNFPDIELDQESKTRYKIFSDKVSFFLQSTKVNIRNDLKNSLYARNIPIWLDEKKIKKYFEVFEKDKRQHHKDKRKFTYPIVKIKNSSVNIIFSNLYPNTASFVFNMTRKVIFKKNINEALVIFNQNKKRNQNERYFK